MSSLHGHISSCQINIIIMQNIHKANCFAACMKIIWLIIIERQNKSYCITSKLYNIRMVRNKITFRVMISSPVKQSFDIYFVVSETLLNKQSSRQWWEMLWSSSDITVMAWQLKQVTDPCGICHCQHCFYRGSFYWHGLTLISARISNHIPSKVRDEVTYPFSNFNGATIEVWNV